MDLIRVILADDHAVVREGDIDVRCMLSAKRLNIAKRRRSVNLRLARSEQVQIRAVQDQ